MILGTQVGGNQFNLAEPTVSNRSTVTAEQARLETLFPTYPWGHPQQSAKVCVGPQPSRMGASRLNHRGLWKNTEISFPRHLWQPVCWYLADVQWGSSHADAGEVEHPWERQVTLAEMVVDFELATGVKIVPASAATESDVTWSEKVSDFQEHDQESGQNLWIRSGFSVHLGTCLKKKKFARYLLLASSFSKDCCVAQHSCARVQVG